VGAAPAVPRRILRWHGGRCSAGAGLPQGFVSLAIFGLVLSAPLIAAVAWPPARTCLDRLTGFSRRAPILTGIVLAALGVWSVVFGLLVTLEDWA
jgi:cytochrome c-type biogenesis protein